MRNLSWWGNGFISYQLDSNSILEEPLIFFELELELCAAKFTFKANEFIILAQNKFRFL